MASSIASAACARVETDHIEVVCFVVAAPDGGVALCVERNEELMIAESSASLERAVERSQELRAALARWACRSGERLTSAARVPRVSARCIQNPTGAPKSRVRVLTPKARRIRHLSVFDCRFAFNLPKLQTPFLGLFWPPLPLEHFDQLLHRQVEISFDIRL